MPADSGPIDLEAIDGPTILAVKELPTIDSEEPSNSYEDWKPEDTKIVVCRIANDKYPGVFYETREEALNATTCMHGRILEANYVPGRAFFRVRKARGLRDVAP